MKYNIAEFNKGVEYYKKELKKIKEKNILIISDIKDEKAFFSFAPLTRAIHKSDKDVNITVKNGKSHSLDVLIDVLKTLQELKRGVKNDKTRALDEFIKVVEKKIKDFRKLFEWPCIISTEKGFGGLAYQTKWFRKYKEKELETTCKKIWKEVYDIKPAEKVPIGFELIPKEKDMGLPLEDYLDSYAISWMMMKTCKARVTMGSSTSRVSQMEFAERLSSLKSTLLGCELSKNVDEPVFKKFKKLSKLLKINRLEIPSASFSIHGKGYGGRVSFGEAFGYPSLDKKTRWANPSGIIYKLDWFPQTRFDKREPKTRMAFTETLPLDIFIETNNIDWEKMAKRTRKIQEIMQDCSKVIVKGNKTGNYQTELVVDLIKKDGSSRWVRADDGTETRHIIHQGYLKRTGLKAGSMSNIPAGEIFVTPEKMVGMFIGDVVINIDQSYGLSSKNPFIVKVLGNDYRVIKAPKEILKKFNKRKSDAMKNLQIQEKNKSLPKEIIDMKKQNFTNIGEFAINTNPKAKLCRYLIVNEKIANMIHIALGSGFEPDRETVYHMDLVIDAPRQKLDIYGIKGKEKVWILRQGKFVV